MKDAKKNKKITKADDKAQKLKVKDEKNKAAKNKKKDPRLEE